LPQVLRGFPQVFAVAPAVNLGLGSLPPNRLKYASGLFNMMRNLGGAIGIAGCGTILNNRTNLHFLRLAEHLNGGNIGMRGMVDRITEKSAAAHSGDFVHGHAVALKQLWSITYREARVQAFAEAFWIIGISLFLAAFLVPLLRKVVVPAGPSASH
jgi:DHA2 family multidrug resistance protein